jgi:nucleotide-binding universal stress UspA family protein
METGPILIGFDGSDGSAHAVKTAARFFPGAHAVVVHVLHTPNFYASGYAGAPAMPADVQQDVQETLEQQANETVERGKRLAREAGLEADGVAFVSPSAPWRHLLGAAEDTHARAIVVGSRGRGEIKSLVLGSTSQALAHRTHVPLLIVPGEMDLEEPPGEAIR